jgi:hypothetical protein
MSDQRTHFEKTHFLEEAERCRRLAVRINDPEAVTRLLAEEYEEGRKEVRPPQLAAYPKPSVACWRT